jgi:tRNA nucleotidyltransferase (CCA-adding enzyme)
VTAALRRLPARLRPAVAAARQLARERGIPLYLAGGVVRDLFLDRPTRDLDLVVEGDGIEFARAIAARLGASIREHPRFGTAALEVPGGAALDVAATRRETYPHPGALPAVVAGASIEEDLARRDFTVNAMAFELEPGRRRIDPFGGAADLARGVIRQLHARCFFDDPTRALRAVRYANRLGFRIHPETRRAIAAALAQGALGRISGDRLRREMRLIFEEPRRARAIATLGALGVAGAIEPALGAGRKAAARAARAEALSGCVAGQTTWLCYLLAWMWQAGEREVERVADRLALSGPEGRVLRRWPETAARLADGALAKGTSNDELVAAASALPARQRRALLAGAAARGVRLAIRGADLVAAGVPAGPAVGAALSRTLAARQDGRIRADDELAFALAAAGLRPR